MYKIMVEVIDTNQQGKFLWMSRDEFSVADPTLPDTVTATFQGSRETPRIDVSPNPRSVQPGDRYLGVYVSPGNDFPENDYGLASWVALVANQVCQNYYADPVTQDLWYAYD